MTSNGTARLPTVREATVADESGLWPLAAALATSYRPTKDGFGRALRAIVADPHAAILVAISEKELVGHVHVLTHPAFHADGAIGWVEELTVRDSARGTGCGRALMAAAEQWARERDDIAYMALTTRRAGDFYRAVGYEDSATYFKRPFR
ncbi:GNAT family N-acetyltransferase [Brachybacterium ginsengisoli]|uniref:GNAT family N-acetyltransferase n=1 Tax=Brachybacterium ginsengisoli TaxID=1331682 RepID=A0A291GTB4_9MICO|nr:GNAT family N-acetyltransferase [Brachybacterium ginsengisoli]ATG53382.1 GNAT family N-acetyltransferase [Brachybacterium ginsengisoli]